jgi:hypothetical protein
MSSEEKKADAVKAIADLLGIPLSAESAAQQAVLVGRLVESVDEADALGLDGFEPAVLFSTGGNGA